ncbi:MAG: hypothetical protein EON92_03600 [Burkholderiales bacterium]|nr:MAG: hypothetical protein EON92_03600 [Burkholderiales bacterium]
MLLADAIGADGVLALLPLHLLVLRALPDVSLLALLFLVASFGLLPDCLLTLEILARLFAPALRLLADFLRALFGLAARRFASAGLGLADDLLARFACGRARGLGLWRGRFGLTAIFAALASFATCLILFARVAVATATLLRNGRRTHADGKGCGQCKRPSSLLACGELHLYFPVWIPTV